MFEPHIANWPRNIMGPIGVWPGIYVTSLRTFQLRAVIYLDATCIPANIYVPSLKACQPRAVIYILMLHACRL